MSFEVACPHCDSHLSLNTKPGEKARCPMCHQVFLTPKAYAPGPMAKFAGQGTPGPPPGAGYPQGPPGHFQAGAPYGGYYTLPTSGMATTSLILGIMALVFFCVWFMAVPCSLISILVGALAFGECGGAAPRFQGGGMAIAGIVCSSLSLLLYIFLIAIAGMSFHPFFWNWF